MRPDAGGRDSYDTCAKNQVYAAKHRNGEEYYVRGTYTKYNLDFTKDVEHMADLGFEGLSMEPVVGDDLSYHGFVPRALHCQTAARLRRRS